jgi:hypothetical protein
MTVEPIVPYIFPTSGGENISPHQVNENAQSLYDAALRAMAKRYNYFPVLLDPVVLAQGDNAVEGQWTIRVPFDYEVVAAELIAYGDDDGTPASGTESLTLTCSASGWNTLTATADHASPTVRGRDYKNQNVSVSANSSTTWTISLPSTSGAECRVYALLYCRYDMITEFFSLAAQRNLTPPPQVRDGEALSVSEWNGWFSSFEDDELTNLVTASRQRRRFEVINLARNLTTPTSVTSEKSFIGMPGKIDVLEEARLYALKSDVGDDDITATMYDSTKASVIWTATVTVEGANNWSNQLSAFSGVSTTALANANTLDLDLSSAVSSDITRCYAVVSWQQNT